jgi:hypothetical protein
MERGAVIGGALISVSLVFAVLLHRCAGDDHLPANGEPADPPHVADGSAAANGRPLPSSTDVRRDSAP